MATARQQFDQPGLRDRGLFREAAYVDGAWVGARSGATIEVSNPATGARLGAIPNMAAAETEEAIQAAARAFPAWAGMLAKERAAILRRWFELIQANADDLALLMTLEQGKPLAEAKGEVAYGNSFVEWFAEEAKRTNGEIIPTPFQGRQVLVMKQPVGVCAAITPWNFPVAMITRKCAPGLAAGCTFVVKPADLTPFCALALAELAERAGMPQGVFNVVTGEAAPIGETLCASTIVRKLSFTGSTATGRLLLRQCADTVKRVSMELGGHAPLIVFDDADLDRAVAGAIACKFRNAGQTCVCANRLYVQSGIYDAFVDKFNEAAAKLAVGEGTKDGVTVGPLIEGKALDKVKRHVEDAVAKGAKVTLGGQPHALGGLFFQPTVLSHCNSDMDLAREETFGPVAPLFRFDTEEEVLRLANASEVGLAGYFFTQDLGRAFRVAQALEVGMIGVNDGVISTEVAPFGGIKQSGMGREGSQHGIDEYLELKYVSLGGLAR